MFLLSFVKLASQNTVIADIKGKIKNSSNEEFFINLQYISY